MRPDSNEDFEAMLLQEKKLTAQYYQRISGEVPWGNGERHLLEDAQDVVAEEIDHSIGRRELRTMGLS